MGDRGRGIPINCRCGDVVVMRTSKTASNPERLFYACRNGGEMNRYHLFKWTNESIVEEVEDMRLKIENLERESTGLEKGLQVVETEIETLTMETRTCEAVISGFESQMRGFEKEIEDCKNQIRGLKNIVVVCGVLWFSICLECKNCMVIMF